MSQLFSPITFRELTLKNRITVAPMCQYTARHGFANDWHFAHLARFGIGGFSLVTAEATAVSPEGRISYGDTGLWSDEQIEPFRRIVDFLHSQGAAAGIQLAHAGRKASTPVPFRPNPTDEEKAAIAFEDWQPIAPSPVIHSPTAPGFREPREMTIEDIKRFKTSFVEAVFRAEKAGFDVVEIHSAHGYLLNQFLSPLANKRQDEYGGSRDNRMRLLLELTEEVRAAWPRAKPLFVRISASDNHPDGWTIDDSIVLVGKLKALDVDAVHCSSGGFDGAAFNPKALYQLHFSTTIRKETGVPTIAVGLITKPSEAQSIIENGDADLVAIARAALDDPNWAVHARLALEHSEGAYASWPPQAGYAVRNKDRALKQRAFEQA
ncbi:NADH:flavin oxidoreductase/NADH oxidase [Rhizobium sp. TH2]|uniref:NADH:flavin oxidoreductase/NADH oxidase n=1 Tax=Rhizobium sp. TH2 TaxID=2775403 RepID=UPI00215819DE|nr:NADH:flavin oxidoreductase/NADH oxidase [Rhizobium sp. TH2]UVC11285.1 NADH:flavin oxidoreductase/NADH oxidase [Rhizobium sp. TH2]